MRANTTHIHLNTYVSGALLGAAAMVLLLAPHVDIGAFTRPEPAAACLGRMTSDQAETLRAGVIAAEARRETILRGGSLYAAAKTGAQPEPGALADADSALSAARARFTAACG